LEISQRTNATRHAKVMRAGLSAKQNRAPVARARDLARHRIEQMLVHGRQLNTAELATLRCRTPPRNSIQKGKLLLRHAKPSIPFKKLSGEVWKEPAFQS
jgi:hypothetical protein